MAIDNYRLCAETGSIGNRWTVNAARTFARTARTFMGIETVNVRVRKPGVGLVHFVKRCPETNCRLLRRYRFRRPKGVT